jgi:hypothetical protein
MFAPKRLGPAEAGPIRFSVAASLEGEVDPKPDGTGQLVVEGLAVEAAQSYWAPLAIQGAIVVATASPNIQPVQHIREAVVGRVHGSGVERDTVARRIPSR